MIKDITDKNMTTFGINLNQLGTVCKHLNNRQVY